MFMTRVSGLSPATGGGTTGSSGMDAMESTSFGSMRMSGKKERRPAGRLSVNGPVDGPDQAIRYRRRQKRLLLRP